MPFRVDEIAQTLGISKRTLYEMFTDKNDLVSACLEAMSHQQRERIVACRKRRGGNPLQKVLRLTNEYIDNLYTVDHRFLSDISRKIIFAEHYDEHREFWRRELTDYLETCRQEQLLLPEIDAPAFADHGIGVERPQINRIGPPFHLHPGHKSCLGIGLGTQEHDAAYKQSRQRQEYRYGADFTV